MPIPILRSLSVACLFVLAACGGPAPGAGTPATPGSRLYGANCLACHQRNGEGVKGLQPALAGTPVTVGDPQALIAWVMYGQRPDALPRGQYSGVMPQFAYLKDEDLAQLLTHVRTSFGNQASPITAAQVAAVRAARAR